MDHRVIHLVLGPLQVLATVQWMPVGRPMSLSTLFWQLIINPLCILSALIFSGQWPKRKAFIHHVHLLKSWNKSSFLWNKSLTHGLHFCIASANYFLEHFCAIMLFPGKSTLGRRYFINIKCNVVNYLKSKTELNFITMPLFQT